MTIASQKQIAKEAGHKFAIQHPFADGNTAMKLAARLFPTNDQREAFIAAWRKEAGLTFPA
jgi:hypothetical protein